MNTTHNSLRAALLTAALTVMFAAGAAQQSDTDAYNFRVYLDDKPIGYHQFELNHTDAARVVTSEARFDVKVLFINAFKYRHSSAEEWRDNCVTAIESSTNSNGKQQQVNGETVDNVLKIDSTAGQLAVNGCVQTFAYWNPSILEATKLLNSQTGDYVDVRVTAQGTDTVTVGGTPVEAARYSLKSTPEYEGKPVDITLWYDAGGTEWLALESLAKGKRKLRYERTDALESVQTSGTAATNGR